MFGNRKRRDAEAAAALETLRAELAAAELRSRAMLVDTVAKMELRSSRDAEERRRLQSVTETAIETLQSSLSDNTTEVARALGQVANICALVAEQIDAERVERRAFTEAIARASRPSIPQVAGPSEIIGGTFFATSEVPDEGEISLVDTDGDAARDEAPIDTTSRVTPHPGTTIELSKEEPAERSTNGVHHQEVGDPRA